MTKKLYMILQGMILSYLKRVYLLVRARYVVLE